MTHHPDDDLQGELEALAEVFEAEDREDRPREASAAVTAFPSPGGTSGPSTASRTVERLPETEVLRSDC